MFKLTEVQALDRYRIWLRYADGIEGEVDLSHLAGKGVFKAWESPGVFAAVHLGSSAKVKWPEVGDICSDALYLRIAGKRAEENFPRLKVARISA